MKPEPQQQLEDVSYSWLPP